MFEQDDLARLRNALAAAPDDLDRHVELAGALMTNADAPGDVDEPLSLLRAALGLADTPAWRAVIHAGIADILGWLFAAQADDTSVRDAAIDHWRLAMAAAVEGGMVDTMVAEFVPTIVGQLDLLIGRGADNDDLADYASVIALADTLLGVAAADTPERVVAWFARGYAHAMAYDQDPSRTTDLTAAIDTFRELCADLAEDHDRHAEAAMWLGLVLAQRAERDQDHVVEAIDQLVAATRLPAAPDGALSTLARLHLGVLWTLRCLAGEDAAREPAVATLTGLLDADADADVTTADVCHAALARLAGPAGPDEARRHLAELTLCHTDHPMATVLKTVLDGSAYLTLLERALRELPDDDPARVPTLASLLRPFTDALDAGLWSDAVHALLTDAVARPPADEDNDLLNNYLLGVCSAVEGAKSNDPELLTEAIARLRTAAELAPDMAGSDEIMGPLMSLRYLAGGELDYLDASIHHDERQAPGTTPEEQVEVLTGVVMGQVSGGPHRIVPATLATAVSDLAAANELLPADSPQRADADVIVAMARDLLAMREYGPSAVATRDSRQAWSRVAEAAYASTSDPMAAMLVVSSQVTRAYTEGDVPALDRAIADLAALSTAEQERRGAALFYLGAAFELRYDLTGSRRDLDHAIDRLEEAARLFRHEPGGVFAGAHRMTLAKAYVKRGDLRRAVEVGLDALRGRAEDVRLQSGARRAVDTAKSATGEAVEVARWSLAAGALESAVAALELGRGMAVRAATTDAGVATALRAAGAEDLATEWESPVADDEPTDLRRRVLAVIGGADEPPDVAEIAEALRARDTSALVYLLPGAALVVDRDGQVTRLWLPRLGSAPDGEPVTLCDWAWSAAMGDVLDALATPPHPVRLVIVPVGELSVVPWHAARRLVAGGELRYACQDAVISTAASARQFVEASGRVSRQWDSAPGLVRVAESGLYWATREIEAIRERYYPAATYLGGRRRVAGAPSTVANVLGLLPGKDSEGASVLHLGCHAYLDESPVDSFLALSGGRLRVGDMLAQARLRLDAHGGLVVLAACASDSAKGAHDEALTLATAFLAAGAGGVVGARWPVEDIPTALFMIMFHHHLNSGYSDPATALRATQVWMLNPRRRAPAWLDPRLAVELSTVDLADVACWGAFTYQGR
jgi:hypothetical protein